MHHKSPKIELLGGGWLLEMLEEIQQSIDPSPQRANILPVSFKALQKPLYHVCL